MSKIEATEMSKQIAAYLQECCVVSGDHADFTPARELAEGFELWLATKGNRKQVAARTVAIGLKAQAGRYTDPNTGLSYSLIKRDVTGYVRIRFTDTFFKAYRDARVAG